MEFGVRGMEFGVRDMEFGVRGMKFGPRGMGFEVLLVLHFRRYHPCSSQFKNSYLAEM